MMCQKIFVMLYYVFHLRYSFCVENVPVYIWGNQNMFAEKLLIPGLTRIKRADFEKQIRCLVNASDTIMISLIAESLSPEDFGRVRRDEKTSCLAHLSATGLDRRYYPAVEDPVSSLRQIPHINETIHWARIDNVVDIQKLVHAGRSHKNSPKFIFVELPNDKDRLKNLVEHDNLIEHVVTAIESLFHDNNIISMYTAKRKYRELNNNKIDSHVPYAVFEDRLLLYLPKIKYHKENTPGEGVEFTYDTVDITSTSTTIQPIISGSFRELMTVALDGSPIAMEFIYLVSNRSWELVRLEAPSLGLTGERVIMFPTTQVAALLGVSYNCDADIEFHALTTKPGLKPAKVIFPEIQMQVNHAGISARSFGAILDCTTVGSIPLAMCGAVVAVLSIILSVALCWISDIKTPERFDNPNGKMLHLGNVDSEIKS